MDCKNDIWGWIHQNKTGKNWQKKRTFAIFFAARGKVIGLPNSGGLILWTSWMYKFKGDPSDTSWDVSRRTMVMDWLINPRALTSPASVILIKSEMWYHVAPKCKPAIPFHLPRSSVILSSASQRERYPAPPWTWLRFEWKRFLVISWRAALWRGGGDFSYCLFQ